MKIRLEVKNNQKKEIPFSSSTSIQPLLPATPLPPPPPSKMSQCVPSWDFDDNPNPARLSLRSHSNSTPLDDHMLDYEVAELTWENGQIAMHGLGPPRLPVKTISSSTANPPSKYTWENPRASGTLESIVNQATRLPVVVVPQRKAIPSDGNDEMVPWFDHHHQHRADVAATASATMTMDALVPCSNRTSEVDQAQTMDGLGTCVAGCSTRVGSCSGAGATVTQDKDAIIAGKRAPEARVPAEWSSRDQSVTGSATCGMDSQHVTVDTCERDLGPGFTSTSLGSPEHTSSAGKACTKATTTTTADDHDSVCHSSPQREAGSEDKKKGTGKSSVSTKRSRAAAIHNQSERKRRDKINQRMKTLQRLVPNSSKTDKASMLDEVIEYLKQLQAQVHMMSRMNMHPMMLPMTMQQLPMSMMSPMGMGMGMGIGLGMGMDINAINRSNIPGISPVLHPAFMPIASWDGSADRLQATSAALMPDPLSTFLACQSQPMTTDAYSMMAAMYQQHHQPPPSSSKS